MSRLRLPGNGRAAWVALVAASFIAALALVAWLGGAFESEPSVAPATEATTTTAGGTTARPVAPLGSAPKASISR